MPFFGFLKCLWTTNRKSEMFRWVSLKKNFKMLIVFCKFQVSDIVCLCSWELMLISLGWKVSQTFRILNSSDLSQLKTVECYARNKLYLSTRDTKVWSSVVEVDHQHREGEDHQHARHAQVDQEEVVRSSQDTEPFNQCLLKAIEDEKNLESNLFFSSAIGLFKIKTS